MYSCTVHEETEMQTFKKKIEIHYADQYPGYVSVIGGANLEMLVLLCMYVHFIWPGVS